VMIQPGDEEKARELGIEVGAYRQARAIVWYNRAKKIARERGLPIPPGSPGLVPEWAREHGVWDEVRFREAARRVQIGGLNTDPSRQRRQPKGAPDRNNDGKGDGGQFANTNAKLLAAVRTLNKQGPRRNLAAAIRDLDDNELFKDRADIEAWVNVGDELLNKVTIRKRQVRVEVKKPVKKERTGGPALNLPALNAQQVGKLLNTQGWEAVRKVGSHRMYEKDGVADTISVPEHGAESLGKGLLLKILKQAGIDVGRFQEAHNTLSEKPVGEKLDFDRMIGWFRANYGVDPVHKIPKKKGTSPLKHTLWQQKKHLEEVAFTEDDWAFVERLKEFRRDQPREPRGARDKNRDGKGDGGQFRTLKAADPVLYAMAIFLAEKELKKPLRRNRGELLGEGQFREEASRRDPDTRSGNPHHGVETGKFASPSGGDAGRLGKALNAVVRNRLKKGTFVAIKRGDNYLFGELTTSWHPDGYKVKLEDGREMRVPASQITHEATRRNERQSQQGRADVLGQIASLGEPTKRVEAKAKPQVPEAVKKQQRAFANSLKGFQHEVTGLRVESVTVKPHKDYLLMSAAVVDANGKQVGVIERHLAEDKNGKLFVRGKVLKIDDTQYQGKGFASALAKRAEAAYRKMGVDRIEIRAGLDVGGYAWARSGFEFGRRADEGALDYSPEQALEIGREQARRLWNSPALQRRIGYLLEAGHVTPEFVNEIEKAVRDGDVVYPSQFARMGEESKFEIDEKEMWFGRWIMLESQWVGVKKLR
jgi:predicted RNA binding protein YcfA (HicA-like mRNA interferase family)/GNAT superfamily N-acetyltransferase/uncharacterized protein YwbE